MREIKSLMMNDGVVVIMFIVGKEMRKWRKEGREKKKLHGKVVDESLLNIHSCMDS